MADKTCKACGRPRHQRDPQYPDAAAFVRWASECYGDNTCTVKNLKAQKRRAEGR